MTKPKGICKQIQKDLFSEQLLVTLYLKVSLLQCKYSFKYWVILITYKYLLYG